MTHTTIPHCRYCGNMLTRQSGVKFFERYHCTTCFAVYEIDRASGIEAWLTPLTEGPWTTTTSSASSVTRDTKP